MNKTYMQSLPASPNLNTKITNKIDYLKTVLDAINSKNYLQVYEMIDSSRFNRIVRGYQYADSNASMANLTANIQPELAQFLAPKLFEYLRVNFPFFNYKEVKLGVYEIVFGQWPAARTIGILDTIRVEFIFDQVALEKLRSNFEDGEDTLNKLQIDELKQANVALHKNADTPSNEEILKNNDQIIILEKENVLLDLERNSILETYSDFQDFIHAAQKLYGNYINSLQNQLDVAQ
ncbi:MAG: hypothetical protein LBM27_05850 [Lactobacillaceae bacterium]|jgi:hypothetical protein|nr:hypothetical protein [Lactobacillaceae bacterium]